MKSTLLVKVFCFINIFLLNSVVYAEKNAYFAAGCFWCAEHDFEEIPGVVNVVSGYTGGSVANPSYAQVVNGTTGHYEAVQVTYDESKISYNKLLNIFWHNVDPTDANGQFCDKGLQYRSVIFYQTPQEKQLAETSKLKLLNSGRFKIIHTQILPFTQFYPAEDYHQNYARKNPIRYNFYRFNCGRDSRLKELWTPKPL